MCQFTFDEQYTVSFATKVTAALLSNLSNTPNSI